MTNYQNEEIPQHGKQMMKGGLPPHGKSTTQGFTKPYRGMMAGVDPNRPGSAQVTQARPFVSNFKFYFYLFICFLLDTGTK